MADEWKDEPMGFGSEEAEAAEEAAKPLAAGTYAATIKKFEATQSKAGNNMVKVGVRIDEPAEKHLTYYMTATPDRIHEIKKMSIQLGMDPEVFTNGLSLADYEEAANLALQGERVNAVVGRGTYNGQPTNEIRGLRPVAAE